MNKIVFIIGPSCSGKSTLIKNLNKLIHNSVRLGADQIRGNIFHYDRTNAIHCKLRDQFFETNLTLFLNHQISAIFCEVPRSLCGQLDRYLTWAETAGYECFVASLDADDSILLERFNLRMLFASQNQFPLAVSNPADFQETVTKYRQIVQGLKLNIPIMSIKTSFFEPDIIASMIIKDAQIKDIAPIPS